MPIASNYHFTESTEEDLMREMRAVYGGRFVSGHDLDVFRARTQGDDAVLPHTVCSRRLSLVRTSLPACRLILRPIARQDT